MRESSTDQTTQTSVTPVTPESPAPPSPIRRGWYPAICLEPPDTYTREEALASVGAGWQDLVGRAWDLAQAAGTCVVQVKEKFGTLRFYTERPFPVIPEDASDEVALALSAQHTAVSDGDESLHQAIGALEAESAHICEDCGAPGLLRTRETAPPLPSGGERRWVYLRTLCDPCAVRYYAATDTPRDTPTETPAGTAAPLSGDPAVS